MRDNRFTGPTWKAPDTLLPRIMAAVQDNAVRELALFTKWSFTARAVTVVLSTVLLLTGLLLAWKLSGTVEGGVAFLVNSIHVGFILSGRLFDLWNFLIHLIAGNTTVLIFLVATGIIMAVVWLCTVWGFVYIVKLERSERTV